MLINIDVENIIINIEATACHIVLTNLIRNAYQHTESGVVEITLQGSNVTIVNSNQHKKVVGVNKQSNEQAAMGYGLGLQLSEKIIKRHGWSYKIHDEPGRYEVMVGFS